MATYNGAQYVLEQLESYSKQTVGPHELVVSDDYSSDHTVQIIKEFAETAPFRVVILQSIETKGYAQNFNIAIQNTSGDLVLISDQDDIWHPDKIEKILNAALKNPSVYLFMNDALLIDKNHKSLGTTILSQLKRMKIDERNFCHGCCMAVRRELLNLCMPIPSESISHDGWIANIAQAINRKLIIRQVLQLYRRHNNSTSNFGSTWLQIKIPRLYKLLNILKQSYCLVMNKNTRTQNTMHSKELIHQWIEQKKKSGSNLPRDLSILECSIRMDVEFIQKRRAIRNLSFARKPIHIVRLWNLGGYAKSAGIQSAVRDLFFP